MMITYKYDDSLDDQTTITLTTLIFRPSLSSLLDKESLSAEAAAAAASAAAADAALGTETEEDDEFFRESPLFRDSLFRAPLPV